VAGAIVNESLRPLLTFGLGFCRQIIHHQQGQTYDFEHENGYNNNLFNVNARNQGHHERPTGAPDWF
jgi:hypothetical protein